MGLVPPAAVTLTSTVPVPAGAVAVSCDGLLKVNVAGLPPKLTADAPKKLEPVIVTVVPPPGGPVFGLTLAIAGGANCA